VRPADRPHAGLGEPEVPNLALLDQVLDSARHVLDRDVRVHPVLVEQVEAVGPEPLQRLLDGAPVRVGPAVEAAGLPGGELEAELRRDDDLVADRFERFADELLVGEGP
jgi:hypothetical protein